MYNPVLVKRFSGRLPEKSGILAISPGFTIKIFQIWKILWNVAMFFMGELHSSESTR